MATFSPKIQSLWDHHNVNFGVKNLEFVSNIIQILVNAQEFKCNEHQDSKHYFKAYEMSYNIHVSETLQILYIKSLFIQNETEKEQSAKI